MKSCVDISGRVRSSVIAERIARSVVAGVEVRVMGYSPIDMKWLHGSLAGSIKSFVNARMVSLRYGRGSKPVKFTGWFDIEVEDNRIKDQVEKSVSLWMKPMNTLGVDCVLSWVDDETLRVEVRRNRDAERQGMYSESMTYTTWRSVLDWLGLYQVRDLHGRMPIQQFLRAFRAPGGDVPSKIAIFAQQVNDMAEMALKRGYKELAWS